jgi:hypothetical protein
MGQTLAFARRINLAAMTPQPALASTRYCLAHAAATNAEYLVYLPEGGEVTVDLSATPGNLALDWFSPNQGKTVSRGETSGGAARSFKAPFDGDAVLYLH